LADLFSAIVYRLLLSQYNNNCYPIKGKEENLLPSRKLLPNYPREHPRKAPRKDSYRAYISGSRSIGAATIDINRCKKEIINPFSPLPNYI